MATKTIHQARVKLFTETFNDLSSNGENEVYEQVLVDELVSTGKFWESNVLNSISYAMRNREIIEHRPDWYSKRDSRWSGTEIIILSVILILTCLSCFAVSSRPTRMSILI